MQFIKGMTVVAASALVAAMTYGCSSATSTPLPATDGGSTTDSGSTNKDSGTTNKDSGTTNQDSGSQTGCVPGDVSSYSPTYVPAAVTKGACTAQAIADFDAKCLNAATSKQADCQAWVKANANCDKCLVTADTAAKLGPLVIVNNAYYSVNIAGCFETQGDLTCAKAIQAGNGCSAAACDANCPVTDQASFDELQKCHSSVDKAACKKYADPALACENGDGGAAAKCLNGQDFDSLFLAVAPLFCQ